MVLVLTPLQGIPLIRPGDDLADVILKAIRLQGLELVDSDILVLAQKIVSKSESRFKSLSEITPSTEANSLAMESNKDPRLVELILRESNRVLRVRPGTIIVEHHLGFICASAGIDHSNVMAEEYGGKEVVLLLPEDPDASALKVRRGVEKEIGVRIGVLIIDSHGRAWRLGTSGVTIGLSGIPGLVDLRGQPDLFGFHYKSRRLGQLMSWLRLLHWLWAGGRCNTGGACARFL
jgi:coenzyme F420-0:L-glutamate ligase/coenzyme F420-1:gamma-L-glutamate ligase